jgi:hypothetical protein
MKVEIISHCRASKSTTVAELCGSGSLFKEFRSKQEEFVEQLLLGSQEYQPERDK